MFGDSAGGILPALEPCLGQTGRQQILPAVVGAGFGETSKSSLLSLAVHFPSLVHS